MNFSLDYDGTYTADPELWLMFIKAAHAKGHRVYCVTMRTMTEVMNDDFDPRLRELCTIIPTSREAKKAHTRKYGVNIDIWIDDIPEWIFEGSK